MFPLKGSFKKFNWILILFSIVVISSIYYISLQNETLFHPYFGNLLPVYAALLVCLAGFIAFYILKRFYHFEIYKDGPFKEGIWHSALLTIPFIITVTLADLFLRFPENINVPLPLSLLFYPAMGFIAQLALHIIPFTILLVISGFIFKFWSIKHRIWLSIVLVATIEAIFQLRGELSDGNISMLGVFVAIQLFFFSLVELYLFRRYNFLSMYFFRIIYYGYWHILWGQLRLQWLF